MRTARATGIHATATAAHTSEITSRLSRHPPSASASGTARAPLNPAPIWMPHANRPVASSGRSANAVFTITGPSTLPIAMPMPIGTVSGDHAGCTGRHRAGDAGDADGQQHERHGPRRAHARRQRPCRRCEQAHAEQRDRAEQPGDRVRDAKIAVDRIRERADCDDLGPQGERREHDARQNQAWPCGRRGHRTMMSYREAHSRQIPQMEDAAHVFLS